MFAVDAGSGGGEGGMRPEPPLYNDMCTAWTGQNRVTWKTPKLAQHFYRLEPVAIYALS